MRDDAPKLYDAAVALAAEGVPIFPCNRDKSPIGALAPSGFKSATTDLETIAKWWSARLDAQIGVPTGAPSGLFAIDVDVCKDTGELIGEDALAEHGVAASSYEHHQATPSGGAHLFYRWLPEHPRNSAKRIPGVDVRSDGGYVIAWDPGAIIKATRALRAGLLPEPPAAVLAALQAPERTTGGEPQAVSPSVDYDGDLSRWAEAALHEEVRRVASAKEGGRNTTLYSAAFKLGQISAAGHLSERLAGNSLWDACRSNGLAATEREKSLNTIRRGLDDGALKPRGPAQPRTDKTDETFPLSNGGTTPEWNELDLSLLSPELPPPPAWPGEAVFGPGWTRWITDAAEAKGAPPDYVGAALLVVASSLIGNARWVSPDDGWKEPPVLWTMLVGPPSANKSPAIDAVHEPLQALEATIRGEDDVKRAAWERQREEAADALADWKARAKEAREKNNQPPEKPPALEPSDEPHLTRLFVNDATIEKLSLLASKQPRGVLALFDELSGWLGNMARYTNGGNDQPFWIQAFGGRPYVAERMSRETKVGRLSIAIVGGIQPQPLQDRLRRADDDGLFARLLVTWPDPAPIKRPDRDVDHDFARTAFSRLYSLPMPIDADGASQPSFVRFTEDAAVSMMDFRKRARAAEGNADGLLVSHIGKFPGFAARIALILAHLDWVETASTAPPPERITAAVFARARRFLVSYALPMAQRVYGDAALPPAERAARRLARKIVEERLDDFTTREIARRGWSLLTSPEAVKTALGELEDAGWVARSPRAPGPQGGRPSVRWRVNPAALRLQ